MLKKSLIFLVSAAVLLQVSFGIPVPVSEPKPDNEISDGDRLMKFVIIGFDKAADETITKGIEMLKEVVNDIKAVNDRTEADNAELKIFEEFLEKAELIKKLDSGEDDPGTMLKLFLAFVSAIENYTHEDSSTKRNVNINDVLKKHGSNEIRDNFIAKFEPFFEELVQKVDSYLKTLGDKKNENDKFLETWLVKAKGKTTAGGKIESYFELLTDAEDSDEN